jgi:hypothetical protein
MAVLGPVRPGWLSFLEPQLDMGQAATDRDSKSAMSNPWLNIPLADYEGHMSLPAVGQAQMIAEQFARADAEAELSARRSSYRRIATATFGHSRGLIFALQVAGLPGLCHDTGGTRDTFPCGGGGGVRGRRLHGHRAGKRFSVQNFRG